jgi:transcriptional regulator with XRE-family HTH domain
MAKITVRPRPGALSELLKMKGMTQMDAFQKTGVDRKTLSKIDRGEEVKLETLQKVANKLLVAEGYFNNLVPTPVADDEVFPWEQTVMLRKLDWVRLEELLKEAETLRWHLKAPVRDDAARTFLEEFEQAVENFRRLSDFNIPEAWDGDPSLRFQLNRLKAADDVAFRLEGLAEHRLALLGGEYLLWKSSSEVRSYGPDITWQQYSYNSFCNVLLSVESFGTQSRRVPFCAGEVPPPVADPNSTVFVNGVQLPKLDEGDMPSLPTPDDVIPF